MAGSSSIQRFGGGLPSYIRVPVWVLFVGWCIRHLFWWYRAEWFVLFLMLFLTHIYRHAFSAPALPSFLLALCTVGGLLALLRRRGVRLFERQSLRRAFHRTCESIPYVSKKTGALPKVVRIESGAGGYTLTAAVPAGWSGGDLSKSEMAQRLGAGMRVTRWEPRDLLTGHRQWPLVRRGPQDIDVETDAARMDRVVIELDYGFRLS